MCAILHQLTGLEFVSEYKFHPTVGWRFDYANLEHKIAIELEGINFNGKSRHTTEKGYMGDMQKYNQAVILDWRVLRYTPTQYEGFDAVYFSNCDKDIKMMMEGV